MQSAAKNRVRTISFLRSIALFTLVAFIATQTFLPAPSVFAKNSNVSGGDPVSALTGKVLDGKTVVPPELGLIEESFHGTSGKTILYIQDAHDSLEAQENIAKIINHLVANDGVKTVFEEGYEGPVPTDKYFGFIKDPKIKEKVSYFLMDHLRVGGAEYAHINRTKNFNLVGADSLKLHKENVDQYRLSASKKDAITKDLKALEKELKSLTDSRFPKELKGWLKTKEQFDAKKLDLFTYLGRTMPLLGKHGVEKGLGLIGFILEAIRSNDPVVIEKAKHIDAREVFGELIKLEQAVSETYLHDTADKQLFEYYKILSLLNRLNGLQVSQEEYEAVKASLKAFNTDSFARFIFSRAPKTLILSRMWERNIKDAVQFYEIAAARDDAISSVFGNYFRGKRSEAATQDIAVLVYGGFHKENIKRILEAKGINYLVVSPRITKPSPRHEEFYKRLMTDGHHAFEMSFLVSHATRPLPLIAEPEPVVRAEVRAVYDTLIANPKADLGTLDRYLKIPSNFGIRSEMRSSGKSRRSPLDEIGKDELDALKEYAKKIASQGGKPMMFLSMAAMMGLPVLDPESPLDFSPKQMQVFHSGKPLHFGSGVLYHGRNNLDDAILAGTFSGDFSLTRVGHQYTTPYGEAQSPTVVVVDTAVFNRYLSEGKATLKFVGEDPYPTIDVSFPIEDARELWVSEETFERYQKIMAEMPSTDSERAFRNNLEPLMKSEKIKAVPGLKLQGVKEDARHDVWYSAVGKYIIKRNLLKEIPLIEIIQTNRSEMRNKVQKVIYAETADIQSQEEIGEKPFKLLKMHKAGFNIPPFFVVDSNRSGKLVIDNELQVAFDGLQKPIIARSAHKEEGRKHSFSGVFQSFPNIHKLDEPDEDLTGLSEDERERRQWEIEDQEPNNLRVAYERMVGLAANGFLAQKYVEENKISDFNPNEMNMVVMEQLELDVFAMFVTADQRDPNKVNIHYEIRNPKLLGNASSDYGIITYDKKTHLLVENKLNADVQNILKEFGEIASRVEGLFGVQQIELGASKGKTYVLQSRNINLKNPKDVPRFPNYQTISKELTALGYGYYKLPVIVVDDLENTDHAYYQDVEFKRLWDIYTRIPEQDAEVRRAAYQATEDFAKVRQDAYKAELLELAQKYGDYILVIKDASALLGNGFYGKNYDFLNQLASGAKATIRGRNQNAIRHEDWLKVEKGDLTIIPPEMGGVMERFGHKYGAKRGWHSREASIITGDVLNVLSNTDGVFVWKEESARSEMRSNDVVTHGNALDEFASGLDAQKPADWVRFDEVMQYLTPRMEKLVNLKPESNWDKENFPKFIAAAKVSVQRLLDAHQAGKILSRPVVVRNKSNFAFGAYVNGNIVVADDLKDLDIPLLAEYLFKLASEEQKEHFVLHRAEMELFGDNKNKLNETLKEKVLAKAVVRDGVDQRQVASQALGRLPEMKLVPVFTDEGDPEVRLENLSYGGSGAWYEEMREIARSDDGSFIFYGNWASLARTGQSFEVAEERARKKNHLKVALNEQGVVATWGIPKGVNEIIQKVFAAEGVTNTVIVDIAPFTAMVAFYQRKYPNSNEIFAAYVRSVLKKTAEPYVTYAALKPVLAVVKKRLGGIERRENAARKKEDHNAGYAADHERHELVYPVARILKSVEPDAVRELIRQYFVESKLSSKAIRDVLKAILGSNDSYEHKVTAMLWDIYLDARNTAEEDVRFAEALSDEIGWDTDDALRKIQQVLSDGNLEQSHKAVKLLLGLEITQEKQRMLFELIPVAGSYRQTIAAYALAHVKLFGVEARASRGGYGDDDHDTVISGLSGRSRNIYHDVMNIHTAVRQGGVSKSDVDNRIFGYAKALDAYNPTPGHNGYTWFSTVREFIHSRGITDEYLYAIEAILQFWKTLDSDIFVRFQKERHASWGIFETIVKDRTKDDYSKILNNLLVLLTRNGEIQTDSNSVEQLAHLDEEHVIQSLNEANQGADESVVEKVEYMLRLYFAFSEKFTANLPRALRAVKEATAVDEWHGRDGEYLDFARDEYAALTKVLDEGDVVQKLRALVALRLKIKEHLFKEESGAASEPEEEGYRGRRSQVNNRTRLAELDHNLHLLGRNYLNAVLNETVPETPSVAEIRSHVDRLILAAKFLLAEGLGGIELEELASELESDDLMLSQVADLVRALQTEVFKATQELSRNIRFVFPHIAQGDSYVHIDPRWNQYIKTGNIKIRINGKLYKREGLTDRSRQDLENALVDELVRDSGLDLFKSTLTVADRAVDYRLKIGKDERLRETEMPVEQTGNLDDQFFRFGQPGEQLSALPRLLSLWSKKGLNLVRMSEEGVPVPPGVVVSSRLMTRADIIHSAPFRARILEEIERLRKFSKYPDLKLLLYARSGSAFMLPGLLTTIPNVGMNDKEAEELAKSTGDVWFAYDTYASFIRAFGINALGLDEKLFQDVFDVYSKDKVSGERMKEVVDLYKGVVHAAGKSIPNSMIDQVLVAMEAVYASWDSPGAKLYREQHRISQRWGTVVILQKGVFGNISETKDKHISGAGSATLTFTVDGRPILVGEFRYRGQGDQIMSQADQNTVSLNREESPLQNGQTFQELNPDLYKKVLEEVMRLKDIFGYNPLVEFVIERGDIWITQSNDDYLREDFPEFGDEQLAKPIVRGKGLSGGAIRGWVANSIKKAAELQALYLRNKEHDPESVKDIDGVVLVVDRVNPEMIGLVPKGVSILARKLSVHAVTLAQDAGIAVVAEVPEDQMSFDQQKGIWLLSGEPMIDGRVISMDGHRNPMVYHKSGNVYLGSVPVRKKEDAGRALADRKNTGEKPEAKPRSEMRVLDDQGKASVLPIVPIRSKAVLVIEPTTINFKTMVTKPWQILQLKQDVIVVVEQSRIDALSSEMFKELLEIAGLNNGKLHLVIPDALQGKYSQRVAELRKVASVYYGFPQLAASDKVPVIGFSDMEHDTLPAFQKRLDPRLAGRVKDSAFGLNQAGSFGVGILYALGDVSRSELSRKNGYFYDAVGRWSTQVLAVLQAYTVISTSA